MANMSNNGYGKVRYTIIALPDGECDWCYSFEKLQERLNAVCKSSVLKKVYVSLISYLESLSRKKNYCDFSYLGGHVVLIFDKVAIEICTHGVGMIQYREMNLWDVKIKSTKDFPPNDMSALEEKYFYDLEDEFELSYKGHCVTEVLVDRIDYYPFSLNGFDEKKAKESEQTNSLPNNIHFILDNGVDFGIYAEEMEYYYIELKEL